MTRDALVVGINQYPFLRDNPASRANNLTTPASDAEAIAQRLEEFGEFRVQRLPVSNIGGKLQVDPNKTVKAEELEKAIANLFHPNSNRTPETALLFFAGHGLRKSIGNLTQSFLATSDTSPSKNLWGMSLRDLRDILQVSPVQQQVIWLDCCFSGGLLNFQETDLGGQSSRGDRFLIVASRDCEVAYQQLDGEHGVLTGGLLKGLDPYQVPEYEWITNQMLAVSVERELKAYYTQAKISQSPLISVRGESIQLIQGRARPQSQPMYEDLQEANIFIANFFGREQELNDLESLIIDKKYRLINLVGMSGIGKSALAQKITDIVKNKFDYAIWKSFETASSFEEIADSTIKLFYVDSESSQPLKLNNINSLIDSFISHKCLLILDNVTGIVAQDNTKNWHRNRKNFNDFLRGILQKNHQSCLLLTSRELELAKELEDPLKKYCHDFRVEGLKIEDIKKYLSQVKSLFLYTQPEAENDWNILVNHYGGNLKAIEIVAKRIHERYSDDISHYVGRELYRGGNSVLEEIEKLLDRQFNELNHREQQIMYLLAIENEPMLIEKIESILDCQVNTNKLEYLSLIKKSNSGFYSQIPMIVDYVTQKLINNIVIEVCERSPKLLNEYPLLQAQSKDYIKDLQKYRILKPIVDRLLEPEKLGGQSPIEDRLKFMLDCWRTQKPKYGYLGGNILNLFLFGFGGTQTDLRCQNFSNIPVWNADLEDAYLPEVDFRKSDLRGSNFAENLSCIHSIYFSPDGKYFITGEANGNLRLWQPHNYKQIKIFSNPEHQSHQIWAVAFSPDGKIIASGGENQIVRLWDVVSGEKRKDIPSNPCVYSVAFSFDGNILTIAGDDGIALWDMTATRLICHISTVKQVYSVAFSNCNTLVSGSQDGIVRLWDISNIDRPQLLREWREHQAAVRCVAFSPDDITIASGSEDGSTRLWNVHSDRSFKTLKRDDVKQVWTVAFSPDAKILAIGSCDNSTTGIDEHHNIRLWNLDDGKCLKILGTSKDGHKNQLRSVAFFPNSQNQESNLLISGGDDHAIKIWDVNNGKCQKTIQGYTNRIWSAALSHNGKTLVTGSEDNKIRLWDIHNGKCVRSSLQTLSGHTDWVWSVVFSPDGNMLASASEDNTIKLWRLKNGKWQEEYTLKEHTDRVRTVAFSRDGKKLVSGGNDCKEILWDISTGRILKTLDQDSGGHNRRILSLAFSPNSDLIASSSRDKALLLWNYQTNHIDRLGEHDNQVHSIAFSPDGNYLISGGFDDKLRLWDIKTKECIHTFDEHEDRILTVAIHPEGLIFASSGHDKNIRLWSIEKKKCFRTLEGHEGAVESLMFSPKGGILVSSSQDQTIKTWEIFTGECIDTIEPDSKPYQGMKIAGVKNLTDAQTSTLKALGAVSD